MHAMSFVPNRYKHSSRMINLRKIEIILQVKKNCHTQIRQTQLEKKGKEKNLKTIWKAVLSTETGQNEIVQGTNKIH